MAHEYILKTTVAWLENWADDTETLGDFLDLRRQKHTPGGPAFTHAPYHRPGPGGYTQTLAEVADLLDGVVNRNDDVASYLGGTPRTTADVSTNPLFPAGVLTDDNVMRLVVNWQSIASGFFKSTVKLYGIEPGTPPPMVHPGPASEARLIAEIAAWLTKIKADADTFANGQSIPAKAIPYSTKRRGGTGSFRESLLRIEQAYHKLAMDMAEIANSLPYHLLLHPV